MELYSPLNKNGIKKAKNATNETTKTKFLVSNKKMGLCLYMMTEI